MARILISWELGGDYGHLSRLLPVARELQRRGHDPMFAVRDLGGAQAILGPHRLQWLQAPLWIGQVTNLPPAISHPELLMRFGFLHAIGLTGICRAWRSLIELVSPQLLLFDHAPTGLLATRGLGIPRINIGDGFSIPPQTRPLPPYRWWQKENMGRVQDSERHAWQTANEVLFALGAPPLQNFAELTVCEETLLCTFKELDHYPSRNASTYLGPMYSLGQGLPIEWPGPGVKRVFAYIKPGYQGTEHALEALARSGAFVAAHVPGASKQMLARYNASHMTISAVPYSMETASAGCDLCVCHGGAGTSAAMLIAGKPLLLLPMQLEQMMTAKRVEQLGAGISVPPESAAQVLRFLKRALNEEALAEHAREFADSHRNYDPAATACLVADRCESLLAQRA